MSTPVKWRRILAALLAGRSYNRWEAARELHDHCLHSTVSTIQGKGVPVARRTEKVAGYLGARTDCRRYWIEPRHYAHGRAVLDGATKAGASIPARPSVAPSALGHRHE